MNQYVAYYNSGKDSAKDDLPYWWNEWANTGFLSGAIYRLGGVAICEQSFKDGVDKNLKRSDLRFRVSVDGLELDCNIEAKHSWSRTADAINSCLGIAKNQLDSIRTQPGYGRSGVAVCFSVPCPELPELNAVNMVREAFDSMSKEYSGDHHIFSVWEPPPGATLLCTEPDGKTLIYPGVAFIGEIVWPRNQIQNHGKASGFAD